MSYQVLARKYRPQKFADVVGQEHITRTLQNAIEAKRLHHAYLFTGVRGVGKTTLARIFSKALNCKDGPVKEPCNKCPACEEITSGISMDVREIDGASNTGVDDVREIRENVRYLPASGRYKIYVIDEVHMLSTAAFNALLKTLEEPPAHVIFIFATTEPHKIPATILSRCQRYDFRRIATPKIIESLKAIAKSEAIEADATSLMLIANEAEGSMRDAESLFDQACAYAGKKITYDHIKELLGFLDRKQITSALRAIVERNTKAALGISEELFHAGANFNRFVLELLGLFRHLLVLKTVSDAATDILPEDIAVMKELLPNVTIEECQQWFNVLYRGSEEIARTKYPKMVLDVLLINMANIRPVESVSELLERVEKMQRNNVGEPLCGLPKTGRGQSPSPTISESCGEKTWNDFFAWLKTKKPQIASILEHAKSCEITGSMMLVKFPADSLHGDMLTEADRKDAIEKLALDFFHAPLKLNVEFAGGGSNSEARAKKNEDTQARHREFRNEAVAHEVVRETANIFGAEIKEIKVK